MESKRTINEITEDAIATIPEHNNASLEEKSHEESNLSEQELYVKSDDYPKGFKFVLITISLMLAIFIMALDTSIIATAVPNITSSFHSIDDIGWYSSAYLLPLMSLQPTFGKIYSYYRVKPVFLGAMFTFELGSIICATAQASYSFIVGRVIAGIGAAAIYAGGMVIITSAVPLSRLPIYLSTLSSMYALASLTGPPLGGVFTDSAKLTWRFCFWINLPFGFLSILGFLIIFKEPKRQKSDLNLGQKLARMDLGGTVLFITGFVLLFTALQIGGNEYSWTSAHVLVCLVLASVSLVSFAVLQWYLKESATIPPHIFANRSVLSSVLVAALMSLGLTSHTFYLPFYFQSVKGTTAASSGLRLLPYLLSVNLVELVVGTGSSFLGVFLPFMYAGTSLFTVAAGMLCTLNLGTPTARLIGFQILAGVGVGSSMQLCATSVRAAVQKKDTPIAATLSVFAPFFGSSLGAAINQNTFRTTLKQELMDFLSEADANTVIKAGGSGFKEMTASHNQGLVMAAYNIALRKVFITAAVVGGMAFIGTLCIKWRTLKVKTVPHDVTVETNQTEK